MKKIFFVLCTLYFVLCTRVSFAYTNDDVELANELAKADIIVDQSSDPDAYRFDDSITRQEVIGMALKLRGVPIPNNYSCKGYFTDATFARSSTDLWVCRAAELAADAGFITRERSTTRPRDKISKTEALALAWKASGMNIDTYEHESATFFDAKGAPAETWQENLLQTTYKAGVITPTNDGSKGVIRLLWKHNDPATRKEVFGIFSTLLAMKKVSDQTLYLNFSGEVQYKPNKTQILSSDPTIIQDILDKNFSAVAEKLSPTPAEYRTEGNTLFVMQYSPDLWGHVTYSSISTLFGKVFQQFSPYNPYDKAMAAMLNRFNLASEVDFYALPYGDIWEKTRDFIEQYYIDEFLNVPIVMPAGN